MAALKAAGRNAVRVRIPPPVRMYIVLINQSEKFERKEVRRKIAFGPFKTREIAEKYSLPPEFGQIDSRMVLHLNDPFEFRG